MKKIPSDKVFTSGDQYVFPRFPFQSVGVSLSGGGFRAAAYGLGMLSVLEKIAIDKAGRKNSLLDNVSFISSASGGTITLLTYLASMRKGLGFDDFFRHLNDKLKGEALLKDALQTLSEDRYWEGEAKARNPINSFARVYHNSLLDFLDPDQRTIGFLMDSASTARQAEFCFNASEFYTGLSFRFQGATTGWLPNKGGKLGNGNIGINWKSDKSADILEKIRLGDVLAASSCFPLGFEPIMFPRDFSYSDGPTVTDLKSAIKLDTYSWGENPHDDEANRKSMRAAAEKVFADKKEFGLMDGGICDNQGLYSLMEANKRKIGSIAEGAGPYNRFDLMMVSDVASFYMKPYEEPVTTRAAWNQNTPQHYWDRFRGIFAKAERYIAIAYVVTGLMAVLFSLPLIFETLTIASVALMGIGILLLAVTALVHYKYRKFKGANAKLTAAFDKRSLEELYTHLFPKDTFMNRISGTLIAHFKVTKLEVLANMLQSRVHSAVTMISDVFLKHIRRLIYEQMFSNPAYKYRRLDNPIYRLSYTNAKNRRQPAFDEKEQEDSATYQHRKEAFLKEVAESCVLTDLMQELAEIAYNAPTTLWFSPEEECEGPYNVRKAIIVCGQFSTCYSLLRYTLSLRHSRHFSTLEQPSQDQVELVLMQLKTMMLDFAADPFHMYNDLVQPQA